MYLLTNLTNFTPTNFTCLNKSPFMCSAIVTKSLLDNCRPIINAPWAGVLFGVTFVFPNRCVPVTHFIVMPGQGIVEDIVSRATDYREGFL